MKTIVSIQLILFLLFTGININFATHYCGGSVAATKVSLDGELANCGMEHSPANNSRQYTFTKECCKDVLSSYSICNNYFSSSYSVDGPHQQVIFVLNIPVDLGYKQEVADNSSNKDIRPPGINSPNSVNRSALCIFRI